MYQILREWPPGFGGVERVVHELASAWSGTVFSLDVQSQSSVATDPLPVIYPRKLLPSIKSFGRLYLPLPSHSLWQLLNSSVPLYGHLPSPGVLLVLVLARLIKPRRTVTAYWHCFLTPSSDIYGSFFGFYQWLALRVLPHLSFVVTSSSVLAEELYRCGCHRHRLFVLPCCLSKQQEEYALGLPLPDARTGEPLNIVFIGRLDSYKRLDWLFNSLALLSEPWKLIVVGDGPKRTYFEGLAQESFPFRSRVFFLGCLSEADKYDQIAKADLLVLPSDRSNEAFGIVQLEAMAAGRIALAFDYPRSGMGWVGRLPGLHWSQSPDGLIDVLRRLAVQPSLRQELCAQSRERYLSLFSRSVWLQQLQRLGDVVEGVNLVHREE